MSVFTEQSNIVASDPGASDVLGTSVSIGDGYAVAGADGDDNEKGTNAGAAYVYIRSGASWSQQQKLLASDGSDNYRFGCSVAIYQDHTIAVGSYNHPTSAAGMVYIFTRSGTTWTQQCTILPSDTASNDKFGWVVRFSNNGELIVGAPGKSSSQGAAYIFTGSGASWSQQAKLTASDAANSDNFGTDVAMYGETAVIGSYQDDDDGSASGSAYIYTRSVTVWTQQQKITASDAAAGDYFGFAVDIYDDTIVVGAYVKDNSRGVVYVFPYSGTAWYESQKLTASDSLINDYFGHSVSIYGDYIAIGASSAGATSPGEVYVFEIDELGYYSEIQQLTGSNLSSSDAYGIDVEIYKNNVIGGAYWDNIGAVSDAGSAYIFGGPIWIEVDMSVDLTSQCDDSTFTHLITDGGNLKLDDAGHLYRDCTVVESKAKFLIKLKRGEWWADPELGSRIHTIKTIRDANQKFERYVREALDILIKSGEITSISMGEVVTNQSTGFYGAQVFINVPYLGELDLGFIPIGAL